MLSWKRMGWTTRRTARRERVGSADIDVSLMDIVTHHPEAKTITMSFGSCERLDSSDLNLFGSLYAQAAAQGQTVPVSRAPGETAIPAPPGLYRRN